MDIATNKRLIVYHSGWLECDPEKTHFIYVGDDRVMGSDDRYITGKEYMTLSPEKQGDYTIDTNFGEIYMNSFDGELMQCDMEVD